MALKPLSPLDYCQIPAKAQPNKVSVRTMDLSRDTKRLQQNVGPMYPLKIQ